MESITYAHLFEEPFCFLERCVLQDDFLLGRSRLDLVMIAADLPKSLALAELVVSGFDEVISFHNRDYALKQRKTQ